MTLELRLGKYGYKVEFNYEHGYPVVVNHEICVKKIVKAAEIILEKNNVSDSTEAVGWGEDFAYYLKKIPGAFFFLGSGNSKLGITAPLHSPYFRIDENCLAIGSAVMSQIAFND